MNEQDIYYLESILRQLQGIQEWRNKEISSGKDVHGIGDEALNDNIEWLDAYIERLKKDQS